ncbi:MAG: tripartite tricarboxylate transporter substrate binding protein [Burkholderiales bacterium]|nr:tripartite tricarboxylate transporter substrate binding protein [Burkholderiales bacterium]
MKHIVGFLALVMTVVATGACAQPYPERPVRVIVPYSPGGVVDSVARIAGSRLAIMLGQQIVVDNRAGGGGNIGVEIVVRATPDGYTLLMGSNGTNAINPSLYARLPFDPAKDLVPVSLVATGALALVVPASLPATSVSALIALARTKPDAINYASSGNGSTSHLAGELFKSMAGIDMVHVPYKGAAPALIDVASGRIQVMFTGVSTTLPHVKAGRLKALGVTGGKRLEVLPGTPAVAEQLPGYDVTSWYGVFAPAGTPKKRVDILQRSFATILATQEAQTSIAAIGAEAEASTPEQLGRMVHQERIKWAKVIRAIGTRVE